MGRRDGGPDAGMALIAAQFEAAGGPPAGAGLEAEAGISVALGTMAAQMARREMYEQELAQAVHPIDLPAATITLSAGGGTLADPMKFGPRDGWAWDLKNVVAASFTSGTVNLYKGASGAVADANLRFTYTSAGVYQPTGQTLLLLPGWYLTFVATGITGNVTISGDGIEIALPFLAPYLL